MTLAHRRGLSSSLANGTSLRVNGGDVLFCLAGEELMHEAKNTARSLVKIGYDGRVHKWFRAANARERFENELRVLRYLEQRGCDFVPQVLRFDRDKLELVTTNCGTRVERIGEERLQALFHELEAFGVRHDDPFLRNVTYRPSDGRFCVIDFEFASILDEEPAGVVREPEQGRATGRMTTAADGMLLRWSGMTACGWLRPNNEDAFLALSFNSRDLYYLGRTGEAHARGQDFVFAVSDGMGGERSGEFASRFALDNITRLLPRRFHLTPAHLQAGIRACLGRLFRDIHRQLTELGYSYPEGHGMGATLSLLWYVEGWLYMGHVGDSRIYHLPDQGGLRQISEDHTHVGWLRRSGQLNERQARTHPRKNVLSQALGAGHQFVHPQITEIKCVPGDRFLLCTDGVMEGLWDRALEELIRDPPADQAQRPAAHRLVRAALAESGRDNATAVVVEVDSAT